MPKLLLLTKRSDEYLRLLEAAHLPELNIATEPDADAEIIFGDPNLIRNALPLLPRLKWAQSTWAGVEPLLDPALRRDYILTNARGVFGALMSEYVFGYLLLHERKILQRYASQQKNLWDNQITGTLRGKILGLLGVGSIGAHLASTAKHFGMTVHGFTASSESSSDVDKYFHSDISSFVKHLDYLVCILPNTNATKNIVDSSVLKNLPAHALFINVGRGNAVDESALAESLTSGQISGAILDVFQQEPLPADHIFWRTPHLFITSHTAAPSFPKEISELFVENYQRYLRSEELKYKVDFEKGY
jgi:phosphoglycerate dehydrogenase-like enzyme